MTISVTRDFLFWCALLNYGFLIVWVILYIAAKGIFQPLITKVYRISPEQSDTIQFAGIVFYKVAIWMLFIFPYIALRMME